MKKSLLSILLAAACAGSASAAIQNIDAGAYTFSYDDTFWSVANGSVFAQNSNTFSFRNLGYRAAQPGPSSGVVGSYYADAALDSISVRAKAGYVIQSITSGASGSIATSINQGHDEASAFAVASTTSYWNWTETGGFYGSTVVTSQKGVMGALGSNGAYSVEDTVSLNGVQRADLSFYSIDGGVDAFGRGSTAHVSHNTSFFTVQVSAVAEPESYAMLLAGLCVIGAVVRRRAS